MKSSELSIIIYSCWRNRDMWDVFSKLFRKYWSDCPYKVVLATDKYKKTDKEYVFDQIVAYDDTWAKMIKNAINKAETPYVMLWMDDYLLCDYIKNDDIYHAETTTDDNMLETAYNMLLFVLKNILGREIK